VLSSPVDPAAPLHELAGFACFDQDRVRVEVTDRGAGDADRDVTVKRFPVWGDAADLIDVLDLHPAGPPSFVGPARRDGRRPVVEGSQMLGQAIVAATRHAPGRRAIAASMAFLRSADAREPLRFELNELSAGRTFSCDSVQVTQGPRCCATGTVLLGLP